MWENGVAQRPPAAKAGVDFAALTARLKAAPFQNKIKTRVFPQPARDASTASEQRFALALRSA
jgi:hypothetical protein